MEKETQKLIRKIFKDNSFAIGDSTFLVAEYISFLLKNVNIASIKYDFDSDYEKRPEIKNNCYLLITNDINEIYSFSIKTYGLVNNIFDNSDVPFEISFKKIDNNNILSEEVFIKNGNHFENKSSISFKRNDLTLYCQSNEECKWHNIYSLTDICFNDLDNNIICQTTINTDGNTLVERLYDLNNQVNYLINGTTRTKK